MGLGMTGNGEIEISLETEKINGEDAKIEVFYCDDHSDVKKLRQYQKSRPFFDSRNYRIPHHYRYCRKKTKSGKNSVEWKTRWDLFKQPLGRNPRGLSSVDCEIYSIMRAEYRYLEEGYQKLESKHDGFHGIDGLFKKGDQYLIVESKFLTPEKYENYCKGNSPLSNLGWKKDPKNPSDGETEGYIRQMSWDWIRSNIRLMEKTKKENGEKRKRLKKKNIQRVINVFGARPVYPPPGRYGFRYRLSEFDGKHETVVEVDWHPDWMYSSKPYRKCEFWIIDENKNHILACQENESG